MNTTTKSIAKTRTNTKASVDTRAEVASGALVSMKVAGALIGLLSLATLVSGMVAAGGPFALAKAWFGAVVGM